MGQDQALPCCSSAFGKNKQTNGSTYDYAANGTYHGSGFKVMEVKSGLGLNSALENNKNNKSNSKIIRKTASIVQDKNPMSNCRIVTSKKQLQDKSELPPKQYRKKNTDEENRDPNHYKQRKSKRQSNKENRSRSSSSQVSEPSEKFNTQKCMKKKKPQNEVAHEDTKPVRKDSKQGRKDSRQASDNDRRQSKGSPKSNGKNQIMPQQNKYSSSDCSSSEVSDNSQQAANAKTTSKEANKKTVNTQKDQSRQTEQNGRTVNSKDEQTKDKAVHSNKAEADQTPITNLTKLDMQKGRSRISSILAQKQQKSMTNQSGTQKLRSSTGSSSSSSSSGSSSSDGSSQSSLQSQSETGKGNQKNMKRPIASQSEIDSFEFETRKQREQCERQREKDTNQYNSRVVERTPKKCRKSVHKPEQKKNAAAVQKIQRISFQKSYTNANNSQFSNTNSNFGTATNSNLQKALLNASPSTSNVPLSPPPNGSKKVGQNPPKPQARRQTVYIETSSESSDFTDSSCDSQSQSQCQQNRRRQSQSTDRKRISKQSRDEGKEKARKSPRKSRK